MVVTLKHLLVDYPHYDLPHPVPGASLSRAAAEANLAWLLSHREARLQAITTLLGASGCDAATAFDADPSPFLGALWRWTDAAWPALRPPARRNSCQWTSSLTSLGDTHSYEVSRNGAAAGAR